MEGKYEQSNIQTIMKIECDNYQWTITAAEFPGWSEADMM